MRFIAIRGRAGVRNKPSDTPQVFFDAFGRIETQGVASRPGPAELGVEGFFLRDERHLVYRRRLSNGDIGIVTLLHERMHQIERFREDFFGQLTAEDATEPPLP